MKLDLYLIIGLVKESRHWSKEFLEALQSELHPNSIQFVDLPGSGKFLHQKSPTRMREIVESVRSQFIFHPGHRRVLISSSLGGMVAWSWTTLYPDDFTDMVVMNSSFGKFSPIWKRVQPKAISEFIKISMAAPGIEKEKRILGLSANSSRRIEKNLPVWAKIGEEASMRFPNVLRQILAGMRFKPVSAPKIPMLVIASKHDRLAHYSCSEKMAAFASKTTQVKSVITDDPSIGHAFHVDAPDLLATTIREWVED